MTKSELRDRLARRFQQLSADDVDFAISSILAAITDSLCAGGRAEMRGFGTFSLSSRRARTARNPLTGAQVAVREKRVPRFKAARQLRERVAGAVDHPHRAAAAAGAGRNAMASGQRALPMEQS